MWVHLVLGLTGAIVIAVASLTGVFISFQGPLARVFIPIPRVAATGGSPDFAAIVSAVEAQYAPRRVNNVAIPAGQAAIVRLSDRSLAFVDPADASIMRFQQSRFASFENLTSVMRGLHIHLLLGPRGKLIVTLATIEALLLALTGLWLWWRKKHWQFTAWRGSVFRVSWDLHNATGVWFLVPALSMILTGLLLAMPAPLYRITGIRPAPYLGAPTTDGDANAVPVTLGRVLSVADSAVPGAVARLAIPQQPAGAFAVVKAGQTVFVHQFTGTVIEVRPERVPNAADHALEAVDDLHSGALLGLPGRTIMTLGSLMLAVMTVSGAILGWKRLLILARRRPDTD
jgi:uncharacterized iron-regulated membrane protein